MITAPSGPLDNSSGNRRRGNRSTKFSTECRFGWRRSRCLSTRTECFEGFKGLLWRLCSETFGGRDTILSLWRVTGTLHCCAQTIQIDVHTELRRLTDWYSWMERKRFWPADSAYRPNSQYTSVIQKRTTKGAYAGERACFPERCEHV